MSDYSFEIVCPPVQISGPPNPTWEFDTPTINQIRGSGDLNGSTWVIEIDCHKPTHVPLPVFSFLSLLLMFIGIIRKI